MFSNFREYYQVMKDHSKITKMHFWMIQRARKRFLVIFWSLVCWIDLILHILIVQNVFQLSATLPLHEGSFKDDKNAFLNGPKSQKRGIFAIFWTLVCCIDLILHTVIVLNVFQHSTTLPDHEGSFKCHINAFWMIQRAKNEVFGHFLDFGLSNRLGIA